MLGVVDIRVVVRASRWTVRRVCLTGAVFNGKAKAGQLFRPTSLAFGEFFLGHELLETVMVRLDGDFGTAPPSK